ncbi:MAG: dTMP kinase [Candidatus Levybacteria bacterium]|nr:dTMP kinase [Candidatus Levybacteria bacterium]
MKYHVEFDLTLRRNPYKGVYIAFEGVDGSGKTTQAEILGKYLEERGIEVVTTSEPRRDRPVGILIHQILQGIVKVPSVSLQYLYTADRIINHNKVVEPALSAGKFVISHRCLWSNLPYGMLDKREVNYDSDDAKTINVAHGLMSLYNQFIIPDITFYLRVSAETAMKRLKKIKEIKELYEKYGKIEKVIRGYEWQLKQFPDEFVVIDAEKSEGEVAGKIRSFIDKKIK